MDNKNKPNITLIIQSCREKNKLGQRRLYELFYSYGISVALRYASDRQEAQEVLNDSFVKVFSKSISTILNFYLKLGFDKLSSTPQ